MSDHANATAPRPTLLAEEVAGILRCHRVQVHRLVKAGRLKPVKIGRAVRFRPEEVERFLAEATAA